ncbi:MAG: helix-turn-helix domain-containing protein, partial [Bacteroidetes bacterium]|nr:helix-turn-helix domain-containing protein [Bacteroidota bacterium]
MHAHCFTLIQITMSKNEVTINELLSRIEGKIDTLEMNLLIQKEVLTFNEAARYAGLSRSYLYKLTSIGKIPHYKPNGKMIYFNREELDNYLLKNQARKEEIECQA